MLKYTLTPGVQDLVAGETFRPRAVAWQAGELVMWAESERDGTTAHRVAVVMTGRPCPEPDHAAYVGTAATDGSPVVAHVYVALP